MALDKLLNSEELELSFNMYIENVGIDAEYDDSNIAHIRVEFLKKIFHSRVNEFIEARKELKKWESYRCRSVAQRYFENI